MAANPGRSPRPARTSANGRKGVAEAGVDATNQLGQTPSDVFGFPVNYNTGLGGTSGGHAPSDVTAQAGQLNNTIEGDNANVTDTGLDGSAGSNPSGGGETVTYTDAFALPGYGNDAAQMSSPNATSGLGDSTLFNGNGLSGPTLPGLTNSRETDTGIGKGHAGVRKA